MNSVQWAFIWYYFVEGLLLIMVFRIALYNGDNDKQLPHFSQFIMFLLLFLIPFYFASEPVMDQSDKWNYEKSFLLFKEIDISDMTIVDLGYIFYLYLLTKIFSNPFLFFLITAFLYLWGYFLFIKKTISPEFRLIFFLAAISALGFYNYGTNTIRAGAALSVILIAVSRKNFWFSTIPLFVLAVLIHKTMLLPAIVFMGIHFFNSKTNFFYLWIICFLISLVGGAAISNALGDFFYFADNRVDYYLGEERFVYRTGFRIDFIIYSLAPVLLAFYYKKKGFEDDFYNHILSTYIVCNSFWLLMIRMPFTDRLAALSWLFIPLLALYPLFNIKLVEKQNHWVAGILFVLSGISFYLNVLR